MSVLAIENATLTPKLFKRSCDCSTCNFDCQIMERQSIRYRTSASTNSPQSDQVRRRSLHISHFDALQNAVSTLSRIDDFDLEELGNGFYSDVFKATHKLTKKVMVLKRNKDTNTKMNIFREIQLINRLSHPNIVKFKGVCVHQGQLHALLEFINGGDLERFITSGEVLLTWKQRMQLGLDIGNGMKYLHSVGIFHRDLTAKNCLVQISDDGNETRYRGFVADLGLAEKIPSSPQEEERLSMAGTPYIIAPEVLHRKPYNERADIFSYGLLLCQLIALVSNDPDDLPRRGDFGLARDLFQKMVSVPPLPGSSPSTSLPPPDEFLQLAYDCCQFSPGLRPPFTEVVSRLEAQLSSLKRKRIGRSATVRGAAEMETLMPAEELHEAKRKHQLSFEEIAILQSIVSSPTDRQLGADELVTRRMLPIIFSSEVSKPEEGDVFADKSGGSEADEKPARPSKKRNHSSSSSTSSRLSRSFSDISRELLTHTANMVASVTADDVTSSDVNDAYSNPFSTLEHLNDEKAKLVDEPSLALLEMTFELSTWDKVKTRWDTHTDASTRKRRTKSVFIAPSLEDLDLPPPASPIYTPTSSFRSEPPPVIRSVPHSPHLISTEEKISRCHDCGYQRALNRAIILSPVGNNLASWWCARHRSQIESSRSRKKSLATVLKVLSGRFRGRMRRCISVPDLFRMTTLFGSLPEEEERSVRMQSAPHVRRSGTCNKLFHASTNPILEESEAESRDPGRPSSFVHPPLTRNGDVVFSPANLALSKEMQMDSSQEDPCISLSDAPESLNGVKSFPLGCSSNVLAASLHSGEVTRQRRFASLKCKSQAEIGDGQLVASDLSRSPDVVSSTTSNRDSGYEDSASDEQNATIAAGCSTPHSLSWQIPEEVPPLCPISD